MACASYHNDAGGAKAFDQGELFRRSDTAKRATRIQRQRLRWKVETNKTTTFAILTLSWYLAAPLKPSATVAIQQEPPRPTFVMRRRLVADYLIL